MCWAVIWAARAERRNTIIAAISSGAVMRFSSGILAALSWAVLEAMLTMGPRDFLRCGSAKWGHVLVMQKVAFERVDVFLRTAVL